MRILSFLLTLLVTTAMVWVLSFPLSVGETNLPAMGNVLNPFSGFWRNADPVVPSGSDDFELAGIRAPVEIIFDDRQVPHIFAQNINDALYAQGYLHAKDRLWQLDLSSRATIGRLSEVLGEATIEHDKQKRRKGMLLAAETALETWKKNPENYGLLKSYVDGLNAYVENLNPRKMPVEYKLMGFEPRLFTTLDVAIMVRGMAETLSFTNMDLKNTNTITKLGLGTFNNLIPQWNPYQSPVIPIGTSWDHITGEKPEPVKATNDSPILIGAVPHQGYEERDPGVGSNNWAVNARKTLNGNPILCNDPHLPLTLPSIWYEQQIHLPEANMYGVTSPGIPGLLIGFNEDLAWGVTNVGIDVLDWYKIQWTDASKKSYLIDGQPVETKIQIENIFVKGREEPIQDTVLYTIWGPVTYSDPSNPYADLAMHWLPHRGGEVDELTTFFNLAKAKNLQEYQQALSTFHAPAQNIVFATKENDIGITVAGDLPFRETELEATTVRDGSSSKEEWQGFIPYAHQPKVMNPKRGFVSSANQHSTGPDYPYKYAGWFHQNRGRHLNKRLRQLDSITVDDMKALQLDNFSLQAKEALPVFLSLLDTTRLDAVGLGMYRNLRTWDYRYDATSVNALLFEKWFNNFIDLTWDELDSMKVNLKEMRYPDDWKTIDLLKYDEVLPYWDIKATPQVETRDSLVTIAFQKVMTNSKEELTEPGFVWGQKKKTYIKHLANIAAFSKSVIVGGDATALNANTATNGPSWRMIVELGDTVQAQAIFPGGPSGNPGSHFYDNDILKWSLGQYHTIHLMKSPDEAPKTYLRSMTLTPQ